MKFQVMFQCARCEASRMAWVEVSIRDGRLVPEELPSGWDRYYDQTCQEYLYHCENHR